MRKVRRACILLQFDDFEIDVQDAVRSSNPWDVCGHCSGKPKDVEIPILGRGTSALYTE